MTRAETRTMRLVFRRTLASHRLLAALALLLMLDVAVVALGRLVPLEPLLRGWLVAFAILSSVPIGSMVLLLIHALTGGAWGTAAAPVLRPAAALLALVALAFVPVLFGPSAIYPWAANPTSVAPDVAHWYLRDAAFALRAVIALTGWSVLGVTLALGLRSQLVAGLGLAFFGLAISLVAVDWYLSLEPNYVASAFATMIAVQDLLAAVACVALIGGPAIEGKVAGDLAALMIATLLGVVYLEYMTFVVAWYGDLPTKASWFVKRTGLAWNGVLIASFLIGALLPFSMLLLKTIRTSRRGLRRASALILCGITLHMIWLLVPEFAAPGAVLAATTICVAGLLLVFIIAGLAMRGPIAAEEQRHVE
jgi:hypothetical protein